MNEWLNFLQNDDYLGAKKYLKNGADVNARGETGEPVVSAALRFRCSDELLELLVEHGADLFGTDNEGVSVFDTAITYNNPRMVRRILEAGVNVNETRRQSGFTALMAAVCYNRGDIVKMLLDYGADKTLKDNLGLTCADYARKTHRKKMLELLGEDENGTD